MTSVSIADVGAYYDEFASGLLADYAHGNPRTEAAIRHALRWIPRNAREVLDVGCGVGWSSWEIRRAHPAARVTGLDLSEGMLRIARALFAAEGLSFVRADIADWAGAAGSALDAIVMLDVYEHIPRAARAALHRTAARLLARGGRVILSFPSVSHQAFLREHVPGGLQPVDEDVSEEDIEVFARAIGGRIADFRPVDIWNRGDYVHAVIERGEAASSSGVAALERRTARARRARERLGARVLRGGVLLPDREGPAVAVISPNRIGAMETFIRAQVERLPARVRVLHDGWLPVLDDEGRALIPLGGSAVRLAARLLRVDPERLGSRVARLAPRPLRVRALARRLRESGARVALAHYGPTGVSVLDACEAAGVPLVVHFHGFDAWEEKTLKSFGQGYPRLFERAAGIVAVSREMERRLLELGARRDRLHCIPCGVDMDRFGGADPLSAPPVFVAVGRFVEKKGPQLTLRAFGSALAHCPEARLVMIGDGEQLESCRQLVRGLGLEARVDLPGVRSHSEIARTLRGARAFVQHSLRAKGGDREGTPVSVLEASASGLPVIATRHGGIPEAVIENETGLLVDEGDVEGMARHIAALARDGARAGALGRRGRQHVAEHYALAQSVGRLWQVLEAAVGP